MKQRRITTEDVFRAIESPDETGLPTALGRHRVRWIKSERYAVDVVYELLDVVRVITTIRIDVFAAKGKPPEIFRLRVKPPKPKRKRKPKQKKPQEGRRKRW